MKIGELYKVSFQWLLPHSIRDFWSTCGPVVYLGEDIILREDGHKIINHIVLVDGKRKILDTTFLRFLEIADGNR